MERNIVRYETVILHNVLDKCRTGNYIFTKTNLEWPIDKMLNLINSVARNFPISLITLTDDSISEKSIILNGQHVIYNLCHLFSDETNAYKIFYDIENDSFVHCDSYDSQNNSKIRYISILQIYDTFLLLELLERIKEEFSDKDIVKKYRNNLNRLNSVFQSYLLITAKLISSDEDIHLYQEFVNL